jgi:CCR4-NOT transcription complex subunit 1
MEVFTKYFRRLLQNNAAHIFNTGARNTDPNGSYQILATEMSKLRTDPEQASKIAESINSPETDLFREFDLSTFIAHFQLDPFATAMLASACKSGSNAELGAKGVFSTSYP